MVCVNIVSVQASVFWGVSKFNCAINSLADSRIKLTFELVKSS